MASNTLGCNMVFRSSSVLCEITRHSEWRPLKEIQLQRMFGQPVSSKLLVQTRQRSLSHAVQ